MIVVTSWSKQPDDTLDQYQIQAFADTKEEVVPGAKFVGMPVNGQMQPGSRVITAKGEVARLKSDGTWVWAENGGGGGGTTVAFDDDALVLD